MKYGLLLSRKNINYKCLKSEAPEKYFVLRGSSG
jgi:hypothetical protein